MSSVEDAKAALTGLESKLLDAVSRRDAVIVETAHADDKAAAIGGIGDQSAKMSLTPLRKQAKAIDSEISLLRVNIIYAKRQLALAEAHAEAGRAKAAEANGDPGRLVQLEIRAPDGRMLRQWHKSVDAARAALQSGYEVIGEVIGSGVVSPIGQSFMKSLLAAHGDELMEFLAERGVAGSDKTIVVLPSNGREKMQ
jgi:hypothetical protein